MEFGYSSEGMEIYYRVLWLGIYMFEKEESPKILEMAEFGSMETKDTRRVEERD